MVHQHQGSAQQAGEREGADLKETGSYSGAGEKDGFNANSLHRHHFFVMAFIRELNGSGAPTEQGG